MEKTLLVGDHLVVDRITLAPPAKWMPLVHYREPRRGDIVVFIKPVSRAGTRRRRQASIFLSGQAPHRRARRPHPSAQRHRDPQRRGASPAARATRPRPITIRSFSTSFLPMPPVSAARRRHGRLGRRLSQSHRRWRSGGSSRHVLHDGRQPAQQPRLALLGICAPAEIVGRPLFNYWSFITPEAVYEQTGIGSRLAWMGHVVLHFFTETRWSRTFHLTR